MFGAPAGMLHGSFWFRMGVIVPMTFSTEWEWNGTLRPKIGHVSHAIFPLFRTVGELGETIAKYISAVGGRTTAR